MASGDYDLETRQGRTKVIRFTFPADVDLTGASAKAQGRRAPGAGGPALFDYSTATSGLTIDQDGSSLWYVEMTMTDEDATGIGAQQNANWELAITDSTGAVPYGFQGSWTHHPAVIA